MHDTFRTPQEMLDIIGQRYEADEAASRSEEQAAEWTPAAQDAPDHGRAR
jgi:hypothetical protein